MRPLRSARVAVLAAVTALALSGCIKLDMDLTVSSDDTVSGAVIFAIDDSFADLPGVDPKDLFEGTSPVDQPSAGSVREEPYEADGKVGTRLVFEGVPIEEFSQGEGEDALRITRQGETYVVTGSLDLTGDETAAGADGTTGETPPVDLGAITDAEVRVAITFPGAVISSNGDVDGNTVVWEPAFGEVVEVQAVAERGSTFPWSLVVAGALIAGLLLVGGLLAVTMRRGKAAPAAALPEGSIVPGAAMVSAGDAPAAADEPPAPADEANSSRRRPEPSGGTRGVQGRAREARKARTRARPPRAMCGPWVNATVSYSKAPSRCAERSFSAMSWQYIRIPIRTCERQ